MELGKAIGLVVVGLSGVVVALVLLFLALRGLFSLAGANYDELLASNGWALALPFILLAVGLLLAELYGTSGTRR